MHTIRFSIALFSLLLTQGCFPGGFFKAELPAGLKKAPGSKLVAMVESDGAVTATIDPSSLDTQVVKAPTSGALKDSFVSIPPGALGIATDLTIQEGVSLTSSSVASALGVEDSLLVKKGPALLIEPSERVDPVKPFTIAISLSGDSALKLLENDVAIIYQVKKYAKGGKVYVGVIPASEVTIEGSRVSFSTAFFGSFQPIENVPAIESIKEVATDVPIAAAKDIESIGDDEDGYVATGLKSKTTYYWKVEAVDASGTVISTSSTRTLTTQ
jgi:hypothetical protein